MTEPTHHYPISQSPPSSRYVDSLQSSCLYVQSSPAQIDNGGEWYFLPNSLIGTTQSLHRSLQNIGASMPSLAPKMQVQGQSRSPWQKACPRIAVSATGDFIFFFFNCNWPLTILPFPFYYLAIRKKEDTNMKEEETKEKEEDTNEKDHATPGDDWDEGK